MYSTQLTYLLRFLFFGGLVWVVFFNLSANPSVDAVAYSRAAATGQDLVYSHHLLHTLAGHYLWKPLLGFWQAQDLPLQLSSYTWLAWSNGLAYLALVMACNQLLAGRGQALHPAALVVAASWGLLRYAVEFEAYLFPLLWGVLATWAAQKNRLGQAGAALALGLLSHQLAVVWVVAVGWAAVRANGGASSVRLLPGLLLVPVVYTAVYLAWPGGTPRPTVLGYLLGEFATDGVKTAYGLRHLLLAAASAVRAWVQVHGVQLLLLRQFPNMALLLGLAGGLVACLYVVVGWIGTRRQAVLFEAVAAPTTTETAGRVATLGLIIVGLWSQGNAEFLAGLPVTVALGWSGLFQDYRKLVVGMASLLMGWNVAFGLLPQNLYTLYPWQAEADLAATPGPPLATYHKLEVDVWCWQPQRRPVLHAQWLRGAQGRFYYAGRPLAYPTLWLEQQGQTLASRASMLEAQQGSVEGIASKRVMALQHLGGPTWIWEITPMPLPGHTDRTQPPR